MKLKDFLQKLKADCDTVEATVLQQHLASPEDLKAVRPGGAANKDRGPYGQLAYYKWLHRRHAVNEIHEGPKRSSTHDQNDGLAMDALRGKPERVPLLVPLPQDDGTTLPAVGVYPKALVPLVHCHLLSLRLGYLGEHLRDLATSESVEDREVVQQAWLRIARLQQQLVWIVTTPGCKLPFSTVIDPDPDPPEWTASLDALDVHRIVQAFQRVHGARLIALDHLAPSAGATSKASGWSVFVVGAAEALGISTHDIEEEIDFPAVVARLRVSSHAHRVAMDEAKARSAAERH